MTEPLLLIFIGAFIGWNFPQPIWAKWIQAKAVGVFGRVKSKFSKKTPEKAADITPVKKPVAKNPLL